MTIDASKFADVLNEVRRQRTSTYRILVIDLGTARTEAELGITGSAVFIATATDANSNVLVRLNEIGNDQFTLKKQQKVISPFYRLYLTNAAQSGKTITLAIATQVPDLFEFEDTSSQASIDATLSAILDELKGLSTGTYGQTAALAGATQIIAANTGRKSALVQNDPASTNDLLLGLDNTVAVAKCFIRLQPGEVWSTDDYTGAIFGREVGGVVKANWNEVA